MTQENRHARLQASDPWKTRLAIWTTGFLLFETLTGLSIWLLPFSLPNQLMVIFHTLVGLIFLAPWFYYLLRHWWRYRRHLFTHVQLTGYLATLACLAAGASGLVLTYQALFSKRISYGWDMVHIISTLALLIFVVPHILVLAVRDARSAPETRQRTPGGYAAGVLTVTLGLFVAVVAALLIYQPVELVNAFSSDYSFKYGEDRPFAPSLAVTDTGRAFDSRSLSGSESCGTAGCHEAILEEWQVSAHRWSAMDAGFQKIQLTMAEQNGPESTRYCGGCHDPISLFSGTKNLFTDSDKLTNLAGYREGVSCLSCHSIRETDLKGNAHYVMAQPPRYMFELEYQEDPKEVTRVLRDFLIRAYPRTHVESLSKRLFKTPEYCAACHKQFIDSEINKVGWVQLQNQFDNWRKSRWNHPGQPSKTIECRECHMPLQQSDDPASGDDSDYNRSASDQRHRSHRFLAANQVMPALLKLPGWEKQLELTEKWLQGRYPIPEIAEKWSQGPAVSIDLNAPDTVVPGEQVDLKVVITSNKVGHDFPTGPLDIIQAWIEVVVTDEEGQEVYVTGRVDEKGFIEPGSFIFKAEPVDRYGNLIDRHNLWEMVGVRHRRALFPGFSDMAQFAFFCPETFPVESEGPGPRQPLEKRIALDLSPGHSGTLQVSAKLNYRKFDQYLLNFLFGEEAGLTAPVTTMSSAQVVIRIAEGTD
ncbi:MAG TPA: multiheme c-type cytochrome [Acidobacteriota bacterium]|nr:multiheme c-type cytochrome [Acidobacteriota bacterium]